MSEPPLGNQLAPEGKVWRCAVCGKRSRDRYGKQPIDPGYGLNCCLNSDLVEDANPSDTEQGASR